jgi:hypothetical protein
MCGRCVERFAAITDNVDKLVDADKDVDDGDDDFPAIVVELLLLETGCGVVVFDTSVLGCVDALPDAVVVFDTSVLGCVDALPDAVVVSGDAVAAELYAVVSGNLVIR